MCGIVGYIGKNDNAIDVLLSGLSRLEYRGYDSAGIAYVSNGKINIKKEKGKIRNLKEKIDNNIKSNIGIGHTRWATHGKPSKVNSHPHSVGDITLVHNGIIENYVTLRKELIDNGYKFRSETDSEVAAALLDYLYKNSSSINDAIIKFMYEVEGAYAIGFIVKNNYDKLYAIKNKSPLIIGIEHNENYIASDVPAIIDYTNKYYLLDDEEFALIDKDKVAIYDKSGKIKDKDIKTYNSTKTDIDLSGYKHFMLKEIHEESEVIRRMIASYSNDSSIPDLSKYKNITIVGCGSAMHAALVGKYLIENFANIPVDVEIASEFRYKKLFLDDTSLVIAISQSGETADTLEAVKISKSLGAYTLGIVNVEDSSIARETDSVLYTKAGPEIAVATTKAYLSQISLLSFIANRLSMIKDNTFSDDLKSLPILIEKIIDNDQLYDDISNALYKHEDVFFIGRGIDYSISMEASLKLKEIAYIHSEAYPAGELKHGTISLIDKNTPVIGIATDYKTIPKTISNIKEVKARGANVILLTNSNEDYDCFDTLIKVPKINPLLQPILNIIPLQLIAYMTADKRGCDIDKPRNLAKSVTVE